MNLTSDPGHARGADWLRLLAIGLLTVVGVQGVTIYRRNALIADLRSEQKIQRATVDEAVKQYSETIKDRDLCLVREAIKDAQIALCLVTPKKQDGGAR